MFLRISDTKIINLHYVTAINTYAACKDEETGKDAPARIEVWMGGDTCIRHSGPKAEQLIEYFNSDAFANNPGCYHL